MGIIINILVIVAAITVWRQLDHQKARKALQKIPVLGKLVLVAYGCLKRVVKMLWETVTWFFKLPFFNVLIKCIKRIWNAICRFAGEEASAS